MRIEFRLLLVLVSIITFIYTLKKIRKSQFQIEDSLYWIIVSFGLVVLAIFPGIAFFFSELIGIESPANFIFLVIIFILMIKLFSLSLKLSQTEERLKVLVQQLAVKESTREEIIEVHNECACSKEDKMLTNAKVE